MTNYKFITPTFSSTDSPADIPALIEQYQAEAERVELRIETLRAALDRETNVNKRKNLCRRIELLETEHAEILRDIHDMLPYAARKS